MRAQRPFTGRSLTTPEFWDGFRGLSKAEQRQANSAHKLWLADTQHPSLQFKRIHRRPIYSVRTSLSNRAIGIKPGEDIIWFWIGPHDRYEELLRSL